MGQHSTNEGEYSTVTDKLDTRTRILKAARTLFVQYGFSATSIAKIAAQADITRSLIFHHFENKEALWRAVKHDIVAQARACQPALPPLTLSFYDFIYQLLGDAIRLYRNHPDIIKMLNWQRVENENSHIGIAKSMHSQQWLDAFVHYQSTGEVAKSHRPEFILMLVFSIASAAALDPNVFIAQENDFNAYLAFCAHQICQGLH